MGGSVVGAALQSGHIVKNKVSSRDDIGNLFSDTDVVIDFSCPMATESMLIYARENQEKVPIIVGTTGLSKMHEGLMQECSEITPVFRSPNMSVVVSVLNITVYILSQYLGDGFDAEIFEKHHRFKKDAPSGTALMLGKTIAKARGHDFLDMANFARYGVISPRRHGEIGFSVQRCGKIVGKHSVSFTGENEDVVVSHSAQSRKIFAEGAIKVASWLQPQPPGLYSMNDYMKATILPIVKNMCKHFFEEEM
jgi:4-hydroxy-tetrahydrodipicolinate reductase